LVVAGHEPTLAHYLEHTGLALDDVYTGNHSWSDLCADAGVPLQHDGPSEPILRRAVGRLLHIDDAVRLDVLTEILRSEKPPIDRTLSEYERRLLRMLTGQLLSSALSKDATLQEGLDLIWQHPQVRHEVLELFNLLGSTAEHLHLPLPARPTNPLRIHARYTRPEILAAFGVGEGSTATSWREGVKWVESERVDLAAITLDKTGGTFSPTTRYRDYAISPELIHWESQSMVRSESETGQRYQGHVARGSEMIMFARLNPNERAFWCLGPATYVRHEGERPMAITWKLTVPLPVDLFQQFAAAVA